MIIFWKFLFSEDLNVFQRDPTDPVHNASEIAPYTPSTGDKTINYFLGIFFIFPWIISTFLNPLLFCHFKRTKTNITTLFKCLNITDFLTNLWAPLVYIYLMLTPELLPSTHIVLRYSRLWTCLFGCFSQIAGFLLAVSRAIKIVFPFYNLNQRNILIYLFGYFAYMTINNGTYFIAAEFFRTNAWGTKLLKIGLNLCLWANFTHCCAGVVISVSTLIYLIITLKRSSGKDNAKYMASCITILLINIPYVISVLSIVIVWWVLTEQISFHEIVFAWVPITTSAVNPIVILTRNGVARKSVFGILQRWSGHKDADSTLSLFQLRKVGIA